MKKLQSGARKFGLDLDERQLAAFQLYLDDLLLWNSRVNLTSLTQPEAVVRLHFLDSLSALTALTTEERQSPLRLLDLGAGAGFPGIPLRIACPSFHLTLLEATGKKIAFLTHMVGTLKLDQVLVVKGRGEEMAHLADHRESYDMVLARGVAKLPILVELALPFVSIGGKFISQKKGDFQQELDASKSAIELLGASLEEIRWLHWEELGEPRALVVLRKVRPTPSRFPRRPGMPQKRPL